MSRAERSLLPGAPMPGAGVLHVGPLGSRAGAYHPEPVIDVREQSFEISCHFKIRKFDSYWFSDLVAQWDMGHPRSWALAVTKEGRLVLSLIDVDQPDLDTTVRIFSRDPVISAGMIYDVVALKTGTVVVFRVNGRDVATRIEFPGSAVPAQLKTSSLPVTIGNVWDNHAAGRLSNHPTDGEYYSYRVVVGGSVVLSSDGQGSGLLFLDGAFFRPPSMLRPPAGCYALDLAASRFSAIDPQILADVTDPDLCPTAVLPFLAWAKSVDEWPDGATESDKRAIIRASDAVHRGKGTMWSIKTVLAAAGYGSSTITFGGDLSKYNGSVAHDGSISYGADSSWALWSVVIEKSDPVPSDALIALLIRTAPARCRLISVGHQKLFFRYNAAFSHDGTRRYQNIYMED